MFWRSTIDPLQKKESRSEKTGRVHLRFKVSRRNLGRSFPISFEASFSGGEVLIRISPSRLGRDQIEAAVRVSIADQGVGIASSNLERIFDALFTTKELKGSGVGLWLSSSIVHEHGGRIQVRSSTNLSRSGTCMSVLLQSASTVQ